MKKIFLDWILPWVTVKDTGKYVYQEHKKTGARRFLTRFYEGHQPIDFMWLSHGQLTPPHKKK